MNRIITSVASPEWAELFTGFTSSAFRLEGLQHYSAPAEDEAFGRFRAGADPKLDLSWWTGLARAHTAAGRQMSRVRIVVEPPSDYTRFELAHFPVFAAAGDDIRIIAVSRGGWPDGIPRHDFWLFDDRDVWVLNYDDTGAFRSAELLDSPRALADHLRWRDNALGQAISVNDYLAVAGRQAS